jgi:ribosomal protein S18 acetylase RimI-like enzyme
MLPEKRFCFLFIFIIDFKFCFLIPDHKNIKLVKITASQINELCEISKQTFIETFAIVNTKDNMDEYLESHLTIGKLRAEINNPNSAFYFATSDQKIVGYLKINSGAAQTESIHNNSLEIERIYVLKEFQRLKIGQILFDKAIDIAKKKRERACMARRLGTQHQGDSVL